MYFKDNKVVKFARKRANLQEKDNPERKRAGPAVVAPSDCGGPGSRRGRTDLERDRSGGNPGMARGETGMIDPQDAPPIQSAREPIGPETWQLVADHAELKRMGPEVVTRYCGRGRDHGRPQ